VVVTVAAATTTVADIGEIKLPETPAPVAAEATSPVEIYGDSSYGTAQFVDTIEGAGAEANVKVQPPSAPEGKFAKDAFDIDLNNNTVRCPAGMLVVIRSSTAGSDGLRLASFGVRCNNCELRSQCTDGKEGRTIRVHPHEATLQRSRNRQRDPAWKARYRATRPKVECVFRPWRSPKPAHGDHRKRSWRSERSDVGWSYLIGASSFRRDGPFSTTRWALWSRRSQTASARVGSRRYS